MSQTFFSKISTEEKDNRLRLLGSSGTEVTLWKKGQTEKLKFKVTDYHKDRAEIVLEPKENSFSAGSLLLCSFELRGMFYFSEVILQTSVGSHKVLQFPNVIFKSEKRSSYRLLTFPLYNITAEFNIGHVEAESKIVDFKTRMSQTNLFKNFLKMVEHQEDGNTKLRLRLQDISTTGMGINIGEIESQYFSKDISFKDIVINFAEEKVIIPEAKVVYVVELIHADKNFNKYKLGIHFPNLPVRIDEQLGGIINRMLRENSSNKEFENFIK